MATELKGIKSMVTGMTEALKGVVGGGERKETETAKPGETVAAYLVRYLLHLGVSRIFTVPGDFTLPLMSDIEKVAGPRLPLICNLNELNSGYAADAYSRVKGFSVLLVTFSVGSLSAMNAIAGMYCEHVPCLVIVGAPNSNSLTDGELVHHTLGEVRYDYSRRMAEEITVKTASITRAVDTPFMLQEAVEAALSERRPVYLEIASNLSSEPILPPSATARSPAPLPSPLTMSELGQASDTHTLIAAVNAASALLNSSAHPLILGGGLLRLLHTFTSTGDPLAPLLHLLDSTGFAYAAMMDAKAILPETHPSFIGIYAGGFGLVPGCLEPSNLTCSIIEKADAILLLGCVQTDYATSGHSMKLAPVSHQIDVQLRHVTIAGQAYHRVMMRDFVFQLATCGKLKSSTVLVEEFDRRMQGEEKEQWRMSEEVEKKTAERASKHPMSLNPSSPLTTLSFQHHLQQWLDWANAEPTGTGDVPPAPAHLLVDCGDSQMTGCKLRLPPHGAFYSQFSYGSLGWGVAAALGCEMGLKDAGKKGRLIVLEGDGGFQMSPQEVSTMLRYHSSIILFIVNNGEYHMENEVVQGGFNDLVVWDYVKLVQAMNGRMGGKEEGEVGKLFAVRVTTNAELGAALSEVVVREGVCIVEVCVAKDDCNVELTEWAVSLRPSARRRPSV